VIAGNRLAKMDEVKTGMACFEARNLCPKGVPCRPHYDEYRRLSQEMFRILEEYTPTLVPTSIDEGFLDFTGMDRHVWRHTTAAAYVNGIRERIRKEVGIPMSAGLASCSQLAKLATDAGKPGFLEIPQGQEKAFLADRSVRDLSGIGERLQRTLAGLGARTFGDVAKLPSGMLRQKLGIRGQQLWLLANGLWSEPLLMEVKDHTTISSNLRGEEDGPEEEDEFQTAQTTRLSDCRCQATPEQASAACGGGVFRPFQCGWFMGGHGLGGRDGPGLGRADWATPDRV
jgi:DNA polymerase-4